MLVGRGAETAALAALLAGVRGGRSGALVVSGEAGIGKSALLDEIARAAEAAGIVVLRGTGIETEAELPFAGLHLLLRPLLERLPALPDSQAAALRRALFLAQPASGGAGGADRFLVGLAVLSLLAEGEPVVCLVDDAHWLDSASADALLFAARRLEAEGVAMIFAARDVGPARFPASGLPECHLAPLDAGLAGHLVDELAPGLSPALRDRALADGQGNPLALTELAAALADGQPAGYGPEPGPLPASWRVRDRFAAEIRALGEEARLILLVAAAEASGEARLILRAAGQLGVRADALAPAERAGLITVAQRVEFRHPLIRAAAYYDAPLAARQAVHQALAAALEPVTAENADRQVWHAAAAASGSDESIAAGLERAAERARERGGYAAAAAAFERAAELTPLAPRPLVRARRLLAAATAATDLGRGSEAERLIGEAERICDDPLLRADAAYLRTHSYTGDEHDRLAALGSAAAGIAGLHPERAMELYGLLLYSAWGRSDATIAAGVTAMIRDLPASQQRPTGSATVDRLLFPDGPLLQVRAHPGALSPHERLRASALAFYDGDYDATFEISAALAADCRAQGMAGWLAGALQGLATAQMVRGDWVRARASATEGMRLADDVGQPARVAYQAGILAALAALAGDEDECRAWLGEHQRRGGPLVAYEHYLGAFLGILELSRGRFAAAAERLAAADLDDWVAGTGYQYRPDLVEAAARDGRGDLARAELAKFAAWAERAGQQWAAAVAARCRALASDQADAGGHYAEALRLHEGSGRPFEQARTRLLYGEWLRREQRKADAGEQLRAALDIFGRLGATSWAERAAGELHATGQASLRVREPGLLSQLTPQEFQIARLAAAGVSNRDIAARLFLSHRTVGHHLYKAYPKLGITSRAGLAGFFGQSVGPIPPTPDGSSRTLLAGQSRTKGTASPLSTSSPLDSALPN
jgi:DNA-binding CsgD family transcriptional regulator